MFRRIRALLLPWLIVFFGVREAYLLGQSLRPIGGHLFAVGFVLALTFWWRMEVRDLWHLALEEAATADDPKHLPNSDVGLAHNPVLRRAIEGSLGLMGLGLFVLAFEQRNWGFLFVGASIAGAAAILEAVF